MTNDSLFFNKNSDEQDPMDDNDKYIILTRTIFCGISSFCCLVLIIIYIIYCLQVKYNLLTKKVENEESNNLLDNEISSDEGKKSDDNKNEKKIGLGSNFMFFLTISNFFSAIFEFPFYFYYMNVINNNEEKTNIQKFKEINNDPNCLLFGFAHNFFDLAAVCWTTMLTLLFYSSTNLSNKMLYDDNKYLFIGFIFTIVSCVILCFIPVFTGSYGFARYYCSFRYNEADENEIKDELLINTLWRYSYIFVTFINSLFNVIWLFRTNIFYSKKLEIIKKQNKREYKLMLIYVWVFRIFPIVLVVSRIFKGLSRIIIDKFKLGHSFFGSFIEYINAFLFASNGIFNSIACMFFFRGVFWCCYNNIESENETKQSSNMDFISEDLNEE